MALSMAHLAAGLGAGTAVVGAGYGISRLAAAALDGSARQPQIVGGGAIKALEERELRPRS